LLTPIPTTVVDVDGGFTVRAELRGFTGKDVEVRAETRRLIIYAKKRETSTEEKGRAALQGKVSDEMFLVLELPHEIDPDNMTATIRNEVLEVTLAKVNPGKKIAVGVKLLRDWRVGVENVISNHSCFHPIERLETTAPMSIQCPWDGQIEI
jgi:HSP20 family molecular chaperone IbpA